MNTTIRQFLFGTSLHDNKSLNAAWLLFRLHMGLSMAIHAGWPKMNSLAAPGWFNEQVAGLGFTFPSPAFWATLASWGEFTGGILIALGLLTRFAALQLAFQFFVVSFLWYENPEPLTGMYFQQTLFWGYVLLAVAGGGRFSLDKLIMNKRSIRTGLPIKTVAAVLLLLVSLRAPAQKGPLNGSGRIISKTYDLKDFDKIRLSDLSGKVSVIAGKPYAVEVKIDDNLESLATISVTNGTLAVELRGNENNKMYLERTNIAIVISLPVITEIRHRGNDEVRVTGLAGRSFRLDNSGNGDVFLDGTIDVLEIEKTGNGNVYAKNLATRSADIRSSGNGDIMVNAAGFFRATGSGNGNITNSGTARAVNGSSHSGNGVIIDAGSSPKENPYAGKEGDKKPKSRIKNTTDQWLELKVVYPVKGSFGITIRPGQVYREYFPPGTKIYRDDSRTELLFEITPENRKELLVVK